MWLRGKGNIVGPQADKRTLGCRTRSRVGGVDYPTPCLVLGGTRQCDICHGREHMTVTRSHFAWRRVTSPRLPCRRLDLKRCALLSWSSSLQSPLLSPLFLRILWRLFLRQDGSSQNLSAVAEIKYILPSPRSTAALRISLRRTSSQESQDKAIDVCEYAGYEICSLR